MKSKVTNIVLIIALAGIWGTVAYRFMNGMSASEDIYIPPIQKTAALDFKTDNEDFVVDGNYRDPFLGKTYRTHITSNKKLKVKKTMKPVTPKVVKPPTDWSFLVYRGDFVNNKQEHVGILTIRNQDFISKVGEEHNGVKILKILKDSIQVNYDNEKKYIPKATK